MRACVTFKSRFFFSFFFLFQFIYIYLYLFSLLIILHFSVLSAFSPLVNHLDTMEHFGLLPFASHFLFNIIHL